MLLERDHLTVFNNFVIIRRAALGQVDAPDVFIRLDGVDADLSILRGARMSYPGDAEIRLLIAVLYADDLTFLVDAIEVAQPPAQARDINRVR
jgi:hypothetical protein